ncbi:MAG: hypothetical protein VKS61_05405 [Candidatus Sericytochromatia bacterium]|nr:hypothetical protein [Candidatus Sericytochromatia bacterium]
MSLQTRHHGLAGLHITGRDRQAFLHNMTTAAIRTLPAAEGAAAAVVDQRGVVIDWGWVHAADDGHTFIGHASRAERLHGWLERYVITEDVGVDARPFEGGGLLVAGASGEQALATALGATLVGASHVRMAGAIARRVGGPGLPMWLVEGPDLGNLQARLAAAGVADADPAAWEAWRVAAGVPAPEKEADERANPWELGLDEAIALDKGCYLGQEVIARLRTYDKVQRRLARLAPSEPGLHAGLALFSAEDAELDRPVGLLTSVIEGPTPSALGLIRRTAPATLIAVKADGRRVACGAN